MNEWQEALQINHDTVEATVRLTFLQQAGPVRLSFNVDTTTVAQAKESATVVNQLLSHLPTLEAAVSEASFKHYLLLADAFRNIYGNAIELPVAADAKALQAFYQLTAIYLPNELEEGHFGLGFECEFEIEHGMGIRFRHWQIEEVGDEEVAFSLN